MKGFKGFNKGLTCQPVGNKPAYQFKEGEIAETEEAIVPCHSGFHFCEMPLDVFDYYPPKIGTEYAEVEALGDVQTQDNKCVTNKIMVGRKIGISGMFKAHFALLLEKVSESKEKVITSEDYTHVNTSGDRSHASTSGYWSHANTSGRWSHANTSGRWSHANASGNQAHANTSGNQAHANTSGNDAHASTSGGDAHANTSGDRSHASTSGYWSHANTSGKMSHANTSGEMSHANTSGGWSHANTSGNDAHASTSGENSIAASIGIQSKAKADKGAIVISDWRAIDGKWVLVNVYSAMVGKKIKGKTIKAGVWYWFENGELKQEAGE
jgi:hypothetical protein